MESRKKDFRGLPGRPDVFPIYEIDKYLQWLSLMWGWSTRDLFEYQTKRQDELNELLDIDLKRTSDQRFLDIKDRVALFWSRQSDPWQFKEVWDYNEQFKPVAFLKTLKATFEEKATEILRESSLLKLRWLRLCKCLIFKGRLIKQATKPWESGTISLSLKRTKALCKWSTRTISSEPTDSAEKSTRSMKESRLKRYYQQF